VEVRVPTAVASTITIPDTVPTTKNAAAAVVTPVTNTVPTADIALNPTTRRDSSATPMRKTGYDRLAYVKPCASSASSPLRWC